MTHDIFIGVRGVSCRKRFAANRLMHISVSISETSHCNFAKLVRDDNYCNIA